MDRTKKKVHQKIEMAFQFYGRNALKFNYNKKLSLKLCLKNTIKIRGDFLKNRLHDHDFWKIMRQL